VAAKYILAALSLVFLAAAVAKLAGSGGTLHPQSRTWLLVAAIFGVVSVWLFTR
jgi:hypothetical protein